MNYGQRDSAESIYHTAIGCVCSLYFTLLAYWLRHAKVIFFHRLATVYYLDTIFSPFSDSYFSPFYFHHPQSIENNWRCGQHALYRIQCHSENSKGVYCLQYDDSKIVSGLRDNTIKVLVILSQCMCVSLKVCSYWCRCASADVSSQSWHCFNSRHIVASVDVQQRY